MNKTTLISNLQFISTKKVGLELYFLHRNTENDSIDILRANLDGTSAQSRLESVFIKKIKHQFLNQDEEGRAVENAVEWTLKDIKEVDDLKNTYYFLPATEEVEDDFKIPIEFKEMITLKSKVYEKVPYYDFAEHQLDNVFAYLIRLQIDDEQIILYKHKYPIDVLSRSTVLKILGIEKTHSTRFSLEKDPLLKLSDKIDFMLVDNSFIILNLQLLEQKYGFNERYLKKGAESLDMIKKKSILTDTKVFDDLVKKVSFSKKLMKVKSDNEVLKTPIIDMKKFLEEYKTKDGNSSLSNRIKFNPKKNKFEVTTKIGAEDFVRLLNDQFLWSLLTKRPFISDVQTEYIAEEKNRKLKL